MSAVERRLEAARQALLAVGLAFLGLCAASAASAQGSGNGPPLPEMVAPDVAGVDLLNGRRVGTDSAISIGAADSPALSFSEGGGGFGGTPIAGFHYLRGSYPNFYHEFYLGSRREFAGTSASILSDGSTVDWWGTNKVIYDKDGSTWRSLRPTPPSRSESSRITTWSH
ncbi:MAG TPA: hypothetical protein VF620_07610 [Allosphingosinicella sp.]|jgi:hypothetical protein